MAETVEKDGLVQVMRNMGCRELPAAGHPAGDRPPAAHRRRVPAEQQRYEELNQATIARLA